MPTSKRKGEGEIKRDETSTLTTVLLLNASKATGMQFNECHFLTPPSARPPPAASHCISHQTRRGKSEGRQAELKRGSKNATKCWLRWLSTCHARHPERRESALRRLMSCSLLQAVFGTAVW